MSKKYEEIKFHTEKRKISDLVDCEYNPRTLSKKQHQDLINSFKKFGYVEICAINLDNTIIAGHQRVHVMKDIGWHDEEIEVRVPNRQLTKKEFDEYLIRSNQNGGSYDWDLLANDFEIDDLLTWGFDEEELLGNIEVNEPEEEGKEEGEIPEPKENPVSKKGDIWLLGDHRLMCGDSTSELNVSHLMKDKKYSLMITDLPYGVSYSNKNDFLNEFDEGNRNQKKIENDELNPEELKDFAKSIYTVLIDFSEKVNSYYCFMPQGGEQMMMMMMALKESGYQVKHELIWLKNNHVLGRADYAYKHEPICYGWSKNGTHKFYGDFHTSVFEYDKPSSSRLHPTMKPIELLQRLIENSSKKNQIVIDPTLGSGSTLVACEKTKRKCYGLELDESYCDVIIKRWQELTGKQAKLERSGETFDQLLEELEND